jgi:sporulation protein YlmC with PRC-barrel domain
MGKVVDIEFDKDTREVKSLILKKGGISEALKIVKREFIIPYELISKIGDKILLKDTFDDL